MDGFNYNPETEEKLNALAHRVFNTGDGQELLNYLTNITMNRPLPPGVPSEQLQHIEGQRWIVGVIKKRIQQATQRGNSHDLAPDVGE